MATVASHRMHCLPLRPQNGMQMLAVVGGGVAVAVVAAVVGVGVGAEGGAEVEAAEDMRM